MTSFRTAVKFFLPAFFPALLSAQGNLSAPLSTPATSETDAPAQYELRDRDKWVEDETQRTVFSSTYRTPDGRYITHYSKAPLNYHAPSGQLEPIDFSPKADDAINGWSANAQPFPTHLFKSGEFSISLGNANELAIGKSTFVNGNAVQQAMPVANGNTVTIANVIAGMDKEFQFRLNAIKYNYVLRQAVSVTGNFLSIADELTIPEGYTLKRGDRGREENNGWSGDYELINASGEIAATIYAPVCYDDANNYTIGTYRLKKINGKQYLELLVPASWLNDISRAYPVTIDPLVTGPTAAWIGGAMPSCISPAANVDSILVTVPGQIAVTGLVVTASFYADPFTTAVMNQGIMWFSTPCNQTTTFTISGPTGNTPGTAYLDTFNMRSPLMCCYPQSCNQYTFWLTMHLSRTGPGSGCNTTYIRYDPTTTLWPFSAYIVGHTVEGFGQQFSVQSTPICSDQCTFTATAYVRYGVPPFTITHPWMTNAITVGSPAGCSYAVTTQTLTLTRPNCPTYCDTTSTLSVPPPTVTDACGNTVTTMPTKLLHLKPTPIVTATPNPDSLCSGSPVSIALTSCLPNSSMVWGGNNTAGTGNISDLISNSGNADTVVTYHAVATLNGCASDTLAVPVVVDPLPQAAFTNSTPIIAGVPWQFTDQTNIYAGTANAFAWNFGDSSTAFVQNPIHTYSTPGTYHVCFFISTDHGCADTVCHDVEVIPAEVVAPNIITPNGDGTNDLLNFKYLEFYGNNHLDIYDRWGALLLSKDQYHNDWDGSKYTDGTYYYVLTLKDNGKVYHGFFQILK